jgi:starch phosphorylase
MPRWATGASAGSRRASWKAWRRSAFPAHGYGIRYDHGIFRQALRDGWQLELPEDWLSSGNPWEFERPEVSYVVSFGGSVETTESDDGNTRYRWEPAESVNAVGFDTPIAGWRGRHVNTLRLWSARARDPLRLDDFNRGDHVGALADRVRLEAISRVLYPSDETAAGHELRLRQEFFFAPRRCRTCCGGTSSSTASSCRSPITCRSS